jgi:hypothetical protein
MKQAISGAVTNRKGGSENDGQNRSKNGTQKPPKTESKIHSKTGPKSHHRVRHAGLHGLDAIHTSSHSHLTSSHSPTGLATSGQRLIGQPGSKMGLARPYAGGLGRKPANAES